MAVLKNALINYSVISTYIHKAAINLWDIRLMRYGPSHVFETARAELREISTLCVDTT